MRHPEEACAGEGRAYVSSRVGTEQAGMRADRFVSEVLGLFPRSQLESRGAEIYVDGRLVKYARHLKEGEEVGLCYGPLPAPDLQPEDLPLSVIFENDDVLIIDKPQGMVVHPAQGNYSGTLAHAVLHRLNGPEAMPGQEELRPGIVHRLDKDTSGVIIVAKSPDAHESVARQFHDRSVRKQYLALTKGVPNPRVGRVEGSIARDPHNRKRFAADQPQGKEAITDYRVLRAFETAALVILEPKTGRTHQLRVHLSHIGCPILGDPIYARRSSGFPEARLMLHALSLRLRLPGETTERTFTAPVPSRFREIVEALSLRARG
ncbi:MAG: RluA family pseudouridine synthase [Spirochaetaceae bacterium]